MSVIIRGVKNTFRNSLRTIGFSIIIAISMGLAFSMLLANQAVRDRGEKLREDIGASLLVYPIGSGGQSNQLRTFTDTDADKLAKLEHVKAVIKTTSTVAQHPDEVKENKEIKKKNQENNGKDGMFLSQGGEDNEKTPEISLRSAVDSERLQRNTRGSFIQPIAPVTVEGSTGNVDMQGHKLKPSEGRALTAQDTTNAMIGASLAQKNGLKLGDTFTLADQTFTIVGIFDAGTTLGNNRVILPFESVRNLLDAKDEVPVMLIVADSLDNLESIKVAAKAAMENAADVMPLQEEAVQLAASLKSIETISLITLVVALAAGTLTILLTMLLVVRERVKEIGVLKALGATNTKIVGQFLTEAAMLTFIGALVGLVFAAAAGNQILQALISSNTQQAASTRTGGTTSALAEPVQSAQELASQITTFIDWHLLVYGLGVALAIAVVATAIPAFLIAKVRPAQIMRGDS